MGAAFLARLAGDQRVLKRMRQRLRADDGERGVGREFGCGGLQCLNAVLRQFVGLRLVVVVSADTAEDVRDFREVEAPDEAGHSLVVQDTPGEQPEICTRNPLRLALIELRRPAERFARGGDHFVNQPREMRARVRFDAPEAGEVHEFELRVAVELRERLRAKNGTRLELLTVLFEKACDGAAGEVPPQLRTCLRVMENPPFDSAADADQRSTEPSALVQALGFISSRPNRGETRSSRVEGTMRKGGQGDIAAVARIE